MIEMAFLVLAALLLTVALLWHERDLLRKLDEANAALVEAQRERDRWKAEAEKVMWGRG